MAVEHFDFDTIPFRESAVKTPFLHHTMFTVIIHKRVGLGWFF